MKDTQENTAPTKEQTAKDETKKELSPATANKLKAPAPEIVLTEEQLM